MNFGLEFAGINRSVRNIVFWVVISPGGTASRCGPFVVRVSYGAIPKASLWDTSGNDFHNLVARFGVPIEKAESLRRKALRWAPAYWIATCFREDFLQWLASCRRQLRRGN